MRAEPTMNMVAIVERDDEIGRACDTLISSLRVAEGSGGLRRLLVTSALPKEGKTTIAACLGLRLAAAGERVLVVDADLRRPMVHRLFGLKNGPGLMDALGGDVPVAEAIRPVDLSGLTTKRGGGLEVVPSGRSPQNALSLLRSPAVERMMHDLTASSDVVVIDSPPVLAVSDSLWLVRHVDGVILVLRAGSTTARDAERAKERIVQAGGRVLGSVLNRFDERVHGPEFHPYGAYYGTGNQEPNGRGRLARKG